MYRLISIQSSSQGCRCIYTGATLHEVSNLFAIFNFDFAEFQFQFQYYISSLTFILISISNILSILFCLFSIFYFNPDGGGTVLYLAIPAVHIPIPFQQFWTTIFTFQHSIFLRIQLQFWIQSLIGNCCYVFLYQ